MPHDGYTEKGYVEGVRGLYPSLRFKYRPVLTEEASDVLETIDQRRGGEQERLLAKLLADHVVEWNLRSKREPADVLSLEPANFLGREMKRALFQRMQGIVMGTRASDMDPDWSDAEKDAWAAGVLGTAGAKVPGAVKLEADLKNS